MTAARRIDVDAGRSKRAGQHGRDRLRLRPLATDAGAFKDQDPVAGAFKLIELPAGDYTLTENTAPPGYQLIDKDFDRD